MTNNISSSFKIFQNFHDFCFLTDNKGIILDINSSAAKFLENIPYKNLSILDIIEEDCRKNVEEAFNQANKQIKSFVLPSKLDISSKKMYISLTVNPISIEGTKELFFVFSARDTSDEKLKEHELLRFYYVAENTVNPLQITDLNGRMVYVNPAFVQNSGYKKEELLGQKPSIFASGKHSKKFWNNMWASINSGKVWVGEVENRRKTGEPFYTQLLISPILDNDGKVSGFFGVHRDLSEKRILEKQLIHTQKMESIGTLAAGIAHEVGNPLASISAIVQVVQRSTKDEFINEKLSLVKSQITRISKIIRDLVDFSRPSNYELKVTDINANISEAVEITKVGSKTKNINFVLNLDKNIPPLPLIADQLQQIFVNILLNAVDSISESDTRGLPQEIKITSGVQDEDVILTFSDSGAGIPEENLVKIFEPFFTTKKEGKGTGLGLWVSYGIIKSFQGDIKVNSIVGKGTTFTITIPIQT